MAEAEPDQNQGEQFGKTIFRRNSAGMYPSDIDDQGSLHQQYLKFKCQSGRWIEGYWIGIPIRELLDKSPISGDVTHLLVESEDEYRACIPVRQALEAIIALHEERLDCSASLDVTPRLVGPGIDGPRTVKSVAQISVLQLKPGEDPTDYEHLPESG